jgi:hypothetical protein
VLEFLPKLLSKKKSWWNQTSLMLVEQPIKILDQKERST